MYVFHLFRSFLPLRNPIGFGAADFIELALALLLVAFALARPAIAPAFRWLADRPRWSMLFLAALPILLRLALLPLYPVPTPNGADDFSYLLLGDTLTHFRLANPPHPLHQFFETNFVLQSPSYSSIYPLGPALPLAIGQLLFHLPWAGVLLATGAFCALCYWMLRGWTTPKWALLGGLLAVAEFGPINYWMNCYWGGAASACAGCLVFGALPRLRDRWRPRDAVLLGVGIGLQMLSRPWESLFLDLSVAVFFIPTWRSLIKALPLVAAAVLPAILLLLAQNKSVTGSWTTLPYQLSRYRYGVPTTFVFQANATPHGDLTADQQLYFEGQAAAHDAAGAFLPRLANRIAADRFFLVAPLWLAIPVFLFCLREFRWAWLAGTLTLFVIGSNLYPYFFPHYIAAVAGLFVLLAIAGLQRMNFLAARWVLFLCAAHFLFWYGLWSIGDEAILLAMTPHDTRDAVNNGDPEGRIAIDNQLAQAPGSQLVFVHYSPQHEYHEWIHNAADIDASRVVWAVDLGASENEKLEQYYPHRKVWLLEADARPAPRLIPYDTGPTLITP